MIINVLIIVSHFYPEINSASNLYYELAEDLIKNNHTVIVITEMPDSRYAAHGCKEKHDKILRRENIKGIEIFRISNLLCMSKVPMGKALRYILKSFLFVIRSVGIKKPDVVLVYSPPLIMGLAGYLIAKMKGIRFVFNMQDIHPKALIDLKYINNVLVIKILFLMERFLYKNTNNLIVYSKANMEYLVNIGVEAKKISIIPNWVDTEMFINTDMPNDIQDICDIKDKFVVTYAGSIGRAQNIEAVIETAEILKEKKDIVFLLVGDGDSKSLIQNKVYENNLNNVILLPLQNKEKYINILNSSNVCLLPLNKNTPVQTVPGKLPQIMACGRPIIACVSSEGEVKKIIEKVKCGICVEPGDVQGLCVSIIKMYDDRMLGVKMGKRGRHYAEKEYSRCVCTKKYEEVLAIDNKSFVSVNK